MKKRLWSLLLAVIMVVSMISVMGLPAYASSSLEETTFGYAYDGQRSPAYPREGDEIELYRLDYPVMADGEHGTAKAGSWTLTNVGTYAYLESVGRNTQSLDRIVSNVASSYGLTAGNIVIHELKNQGSHIAYGVTVAYDPSRGLAMYIGDSLSSGAGYVLSVEEITEDSVIAMASVGVGHWTPPPTYAITASAAENGTVKTNITESLAGETITITATPDTGYKVASISVKDADGGDVAVSGNTFTMPAKNVTVTVSFAIKSYTVTYVADGETVGEPQTVEHGKDAAAPEIPAKTGYDQTAPTWDKDGTNITEDTTINAVYTINKYTVTYVADGETVDTQTVEHGKDAAAPEIPAKTGYDQTAPTWDKDGTNITEDTTINAVYTPNKYTVAYVADGETVGEPQTVEHGKDATAPEIPAKTGYDQTAPTWDKDGKNITADTTITAQYTINKYTVTYVADGETVGEPQTVEHGKDAAAPEIPAKTGYDQTAPTWDKDGTNITEDTTINAVYTINKYTVTYVADGQTVGEPQTVDHGGSAVAPEIPAKSGYTAKWDKNSTNITEDTTITAVYTAVPVETPDAGIPQTGDENQILLWTLVLMLSAASVVILGAKSRKTHK